MIFRLTLLLSLIWIAPVYGANLSLVVTPEGYVFDYAILELALNAKHCA